MSIRARTKAGWKFGIEGILPAEEIGFVELPSGGVVYIWLAPSVGAAKRIAATANRHNRNGSGSVRNDAVARGKGVTTASVSPHVENYAEVRLIGHCLDNA
jgi:hypothetical protein